MTSTSRLPRARRLRQLLILDAALYTTSGLAYLLAGDPLAPLLGLDAAVLRPIGGFLVVAGLAVAVLARQTEISPASSLAIVTANIVWAGGTLLVLIFGALSPSRVGGIWIAAQSVAAGVLAALRARPGGWPDPDAGATYSTLQPYLRGNRQRYLWPPS